ncbi:MAG TPA: hypothetical protein VHS34_09000 [Terriglobales bacterium]|jgi:hypothetical protein|nr:hypothetical protein [Terriglobales bacterium]
MATRQATKAVAPIKGAVVFTKAEASTSPPGNRRNRLSMRVIQAAPVARTTRVLRVMYPGRTMKTRMVKDLARAQLRTVTATAVEVEASAVETGTRTATMTATCPVIEVEILLPTAADTRRVIAKA